MSWRCWAEVDLEAIAHNSRELKSLAPRSLFMAVVKANGYGHGSVQVARAALRAGADWLGVATVDEAFHLRDSRIGAPILVLGYTDPRWYPQLVERDVTITVTSRHDLEQLDGAGKAAGKRARAHLKVDTGMGRLGVPPREEGVAVYLDGLGMEGVGLEGAFTHFAEADVPESPYTLEQLGHFRRFLELLEERGVVPLRHAANTGAIINFPETHFDLVRAGIGLYGLYPPGDLRGKAELRPSMTWKARVTQVKRVPAGQAISYGRTYRMDREGHVATLGVGYADGYTRRLSGNSEVILGGKRVPIIGRICMDQMMTLVGPAVKAGDVAVLMGASDGLSIPCEELAARSGTINHEIVCGISARVPRIYPGHESGEV